MTELGTDAEATELLKQLTVAQLRHVHNMTDAESIDHSQWSDDGYDYLKGALALGHELLVAEYDSDLTTFRKLFDPKSDAFIPLNYACDGVCEEVWKLIPENWPELNDRVTVVGEPEFKPATISFDDELIPTDELVSTERIEKVVENIIKPDNS